MSRSIEAGRTISKTKREGREDPETGRAVDQRGEHGAHERKHKRMRVMSTWKVGFPVIKIRQRLSEEGTQVSRKSLYFLIKSTKKPAV